MKPDRYVHNLNLIRKFRVRNTVQLYNEEESYFDRDSFSRFSAPLSTVNAWYSPTTNTITIFAGILKAPFYYEKYNDASLYASIGMVAAHELGHSMDPTGRLFDQNGNLNQWFSDLSARQFNERTHCVVKEYGGDPPLGCDIQSNYGEQTLGEDVADIVGVKLAYEAYFFDSDDPHRNDQEMKQYFFYTFAQNWCEKYDLEHKCSRARQDVHAIAEYRVKKTLRQLHYFHEAFHCPNNSEMVHEDGHCVIYGADELE